MHSPRLSPPQRGFTLIEVLAGLAVSSVILIGILATFVAVQASFQREAVVKSAVAGSRESSIYLERMLKMAGYGIDPRFAFDFGVPGSGLTKDNDTVVAGVQTDDLAFRYRSPTFLRRGAVSGTSSFTIELDGATPALGIGLTAGQPLLVGCRGGASYWVARLASDAAADATQLQVDSYGAPFTDTSPSGAAPPPCMYSVEGDDAAYVMLLREVRIRVREFDGRPYLCVFNGLGDPADSTNFDPIAADVESFQVSYVMNQPAAAMGLAALDQAGNSNWILGDAANDPLPDPAAAAPAYDTPYRDASRFSAHPANIRAVRFALSVRSTSRQESMQSRQVAFENMAAIDANAPHDGFYRTFINGAVRTPNLLSRSFFIPPLGDSASGLNAWGG